MNEAIIAWLESPDGERWSRWEHCEKHLAEWETRMPVTLVSIKDDVQLFKAGHGIGDSSNNFVNEYIWLA